MKKLSSYPSELAIVAALERKLNMMRFRQMGLISIFVLAVSSALSAQDPAVLLEKAIYTEETLGNINEAISIYQQVIAATDSSRTTAAMAVYRLGMCYQKIGRATDAQAAFSKLAKMYPEQQNLISKIPGAPAKGLQLRKTPWADGEVLRFGEKQENDGKGSQEAITAEYSMESVQLGGKTVWKLQCLKLISVPRLPGVETRRFQFSTVYMDPANLMPISSDVKQPAALSFGFLTTKYANSFSPGLIDQSSMLDSGGVTKKRLALDREVYDYSQLEMIIRCLPLREGYQTILPVAFQNGPQDIKITVPVREIITVAAGTFDCYKVIANAPEQVAIYWISADANAYIAKFDQGDFQTRELKTIKKIDHTKPVNFEDRDFGIKLIAPPQWYISHAWSAPAIRLIETETGVDGRLEVIDEPGGNERVDPSALLDNTVKRDIASNENIIGAYIDRPESRIRETISGQPAISYIADSTRVIGLETVQYVHFFTKSNKVYKLIFRMRAKDFNNMKPTLDSIVKSITVQ
jgi:tetratricopeptide (TPR) repeat protein